MWMQLPGDGARVTVLAVSDFTLLASSMNTHQLITFITCGGPCLSLGVGGRVGSMSSGCFPTPCTVSVGKVPTL